MDAAPGEKRAAAVPSAAVWAAASRPRTLAAALVPVLTGTALAARVDAWHPAPALYCLLFALLVQVGTNFANDYFDFVKGADTAERLGPTRVTAAGLVAPAAMRRATVAVFTLAFAVGINLVAYGGWWLVAVGVTSIACGLAYTGGPFPLAYNSLGDLFVFVFFGLVAVVFTFYVQTGVFSRDAWLAGAAVGALATNILVVNNIRDRDTDARAGKKTLVVRLGRRFAERQYAGGIAVAAAAVVALSFYGYRWPILLPLVMLIPARRLCGDLRKADTGKEFNRILGRTGAFLIGYGGLLSVGIVFA